MSEPLQCDVCGGEMQPGIALNSAMRDHCIYSWTPWADHKTIGFIPVQKCRECGRSVNAEEAIRLSKFG